jgi:hypothetical protein
MEAKSMLKYHRGERRYQRRRMIDHLHRQEARTAGQGSSWWGGEVARDAFLFNVARIRARTRTLCSCPMCASPRKLYGNGHGGRTFQELRFACRLTDHE